ncbi:MAG TPA: pyrroline-5-carboxylate reductase [Flavobacteriia bacterium]|jgi:pyrroline-5-carboxylate reductase|nr:pyrroline-5-carboxylate reductase [Flavobacteriia bacterium]
MNIAIIGAGNLGKSIANGLLEAKIISPKDLTLTKRHIQTLTSYQKKGINVTKDNTQAVKNSDIVFLCVQPHKLKDIIDNIKNDLSNKIVISTITGVTLKELKSYFNDGVILFRAMPNTAIAIQESMTCIATDNASEKEKNTVKNLFSVLGETLFIDDELMGAATVLGASGIAFAMRFVRASMQAGIEIGFESDDAQKIAAQTIKGAVSLLLKNNSHPESEIDKVTTPLGITITGLNTMEQNGFSASLTQGIKASYDKIKKVNE